MLNKLCFWKTASPQEQWQLMINNLFDDNLSTHPLNNDSNRLAAPFPENENEKIQFLQLFYRKQKKIIGTLTQEIKKDFFQQLEQSKRYCYLSFAFCLLGLYCFLATILLNGLRIIPKAEQLTIVGDVLLLVCTPIFCLISCITRARAESSESSASLDNAIRNSKPLFGKPPEQSTSSQDDFPPSKQAVQQLEQKATDMLKKLDNYNPNSSSITPIQQEINEDYEQVIQTYFPDWNDSDNEPLKEEILIARPSPK